MLFNMNRRFRSLDREEQDRRIVEFNSRIEEGYNTRNRGRKCNVKDGRVDPLTMRVSLLEGVTFHSLSITQKPSGLLHFLCITRAGGEEFRSYVDDVADILF